MMTFLLAQTTETHLLEILRQGLDPTSQFPQTENDIIHVYTHKSTGAQPHTAVLTKLPKMQ